jgi:hypothetical protein
MFAHLRFSSARRTAFLRSETQRKLELGLAYITLLAFAVGANAPEQTSPTIELPTVIVTDSRDLPPPEQWRYATIPGFEILSNASDGATQRLITEFDQFRQALGFVWPVRIGAGQITSLIVCDRLASFESFVPEDKIRADTAMATLLLQKDYHAAIVVNLGATTLHVLSSMTDVDPSAVNDTSAVSVEHDKLLFREYVRCLLSRAEPRLPAWFEEGLAQIVMTMQFDRRHIDVGRLEDPNTTSVAAGSLSMVASALEDGRGFVAGPGFPPDNPIVDPDDRGFQSSLLGTGLISLGDLFAVPHDAPETQNPLGRNRWTKEAYAFMHMCLYGYDGKYKKPLSAFLIRATHEPVTEAMFKDCFNASYNDMLIQLRSYAGTAASHWMQFRAKKDGPDLITAPQGLTWRDATEPEVGRIKGEALAIAGKKDLARQEFTTPYLRGRRDADLLAALGTFEHDDGHDDRARKVLEAACQGKTKQPDAYLELARIRFADATAAAANGAQISELQTTAVLDLLRQARPLRPRRPETYELMADVWLRSTTRPKPDDVYVLAEGVQLFPDRLKLAYQTAMLAGDIHELAVAHSLAEYGMKAAPDADTKNRFAQLNASLPPEPTPSAQIRQK